MTSMFSTLGKIKVPKSCDVLAQKLQQAILSGNYAPGAPLPTERELVRTTGLSRGSIREALRILEAQGLVSTRAGRYGGSVVSRPTDALLDQHINLFARANGVPLHSLVEARQALEPMVAYLAARNRTESDLEELRRISALLEASLTDVPQFLEENAAWHSALSAATHNELLRALTSSISGLMMEASRIENFASSEHVRRLVTHAHRRILDAIEVQDGDAARRRAARDVEAYAKYLEAAVAATGRDATLAPIEGAEL